MVDEDGKTEVQSQPALALVSQRHQLFLCFRDEAGVRRELVDGRALIGSSSEAPICVNERTVSRLHAEIERRPNGEVWIRDFGSTNGTWVDGVLVQSARVRLDGSFRLGATTFTMATGPLSDVPLWPDERCGQLVARSASMRELFMLLARYAATDSSILVQGDTGTGKELVAQTIHEMSPRAAQPFVVVDCAALPDNLLEGELFGHAKGAFTGAVGARVGALESADRGTVFLDEIGELPLAMQPKLLRALESKTIRRLGETDHRRIDVRFVAATHRDLRAMVAQGAFREDLYFRLSVLPAFIPPLRERPEDIPLLLDLFLKDHAIHIPADIVAALLGRPWMGNVRELRSFAERVIAVGADRAWQLTRDGSEVEMPPPPVPDSDSGPPTVSIDLPFKVLRERVTDQLERDYLTLLVARHGRKDVPALAQAAGLDRSYVHRLLRKHGL